MTKDRVGSRTTQQMIVAAGMALVVALGPGGSAAASGLYRVHVAPSSLNGGIFSSAAPVPLSGRDGLGLVPVGGPDSLLPLRALDLGGPALSLVPVTPALIERSVPPLSAQKTPITHTGTSQTPLPGAAGSLTSVQAALSSESEGNPTQVSDALTGIYDGAENRPSATESRIPAAPPQASAVGPSQAHRRPFLSRSARTPAQVARIQEARDQLADAGGYGGSEPNYPQLLSNALTGMAGLLISVLVGSGYGLLAQAIHTGFRIRDYTTTQRTGQGFDLTSARTFLIASGLGASLGAFLNLWWHTSPFEFDVFMGILTLSLTYLGVVHLSGRHQAAVMRAVNIGQTSPAPKVPATNFNPKDLYAHALNVARAAAHELGGPGASIEFSTVDGQTDTWEKTDYPPQPLYYVFRVIRENRDADVATLSIQYTWDSEGFSYAGTHIGALAPHGIIPNKHPTPTREFSPDEFAAASLLTSEQAFQAAVKLIPEVERYHREGFSLLRQKNTMGQVDLIYRFSVGVYGPVYIDARTGQWVAY